MSPTSYQLLHPASLVGGIGFEPMKAKPADLQSAPFNHSGIRPHGAGNRTRTYDLLITNQLLYQLSYASTSVTRVIIHTGHLIVKSFHGSFLSLTPTDYSTNRRCCPPFPHSLFKMKYSLLRFFLAAHQFHRPADITVQYFLRTF